MSTQMKCLINPKRGYDGQKRSRVKVSHTKTRTGCVRCKDRRIKCDESRPGCQRCQRLGVACPGYPSLQVKLFGLSVDSGFTSDFDKKCFDSFFVDGARHLSNFQPNSWEFWTVLLPQLSQIHLCLRHGVIALSLCHEPLPSNTSTKVKLVRRANLLNDIIGHYNQSLRGFASSLSNMSVEAKLTCCFVLIALTIYMDRVAACETHILAAYQFIEDWELRAQRGEIHRDRNMTDTFIPVAKKMLLDTCIFNNTAPSLSRYSIDPIAGWTDELLSVPIFFTDVENTWACLGHLLKCAIVSSQAILPFDDVARLRLRQALENFAITLHRSDLKILSGRELPQVQIDTHIKNLWLHHYAITIMSRCLPSMKESQYEALEQEFEVLLLQVRQALQTEQLESWRVGMGYLPPLFLIATKARCSRIRQEALDLLHQSGRIEIFWTSCMAYTVARFVVDFEEVSLRDSMKNSSVSRKYITLEKLRPDPVAQVIHIQFTTQIDDQTYPPTWTQVPCSIAIPIHETAPDNAITSAVVKAFGYSGILLFSGKIGCTCNNDEPSEAGVTVPDRPG